jgi:SAM-dependent methyltransferase
MSVATFVWGGLAALWTLDALRLRGRATRLAVLPPSDEPPAPHHRLFTRPGVVVDEATHRAASAYATAHALEVLDLVPPSIGAWRATIFLSAVDPARYRNERLCDGRSAGDAILVDTRLLERIGRPAEPPTNAVELEQLARLLKRYASTSADFAIAPSLQSAPLPLRDRRRLVRLVFSDLVLPVLALQLALLVVGPLLAPIAGAAAVAAFHLQQLLVTAGTALAPRGRLLYALFRTPIDLASSFGPTTPLRAGARAVVTAEQRATYAALVAGGTAPLFEPRRDDCPVCGGHDLAPSLRVPDQFQWKPGRFVLERCAGCGHLFQNPRLSLAGLDYYYRDFYDGLGEEGLEWIFASDRTPYEQRARMVGAIATPARWLDVGCGHGHLCAVMRDLWPDARFDGLDLSESVDDAHRRRWIDHAFRGLFPDLAPSLAAESPRYDVVSMSHYLEHTRDPRLEIAAAAQVLPAGGLLLIELPDPECTTGRLLGRLWLPWFQPQHQHLLSVANLEKLLRAGGFEPVKVHRGEAHQTVDLFFGAYLLFAHLAPPLDRPWHPPSSSLRRLAFHLVWTLSLPAMALAWLLDRLLAPLLRRPGWSNTYRLLARRLP